MFQFGLIFLIVLVLILLYLIGGGLLEHYRIHIIHETGLGIIMGMIIGFAIYEIDQSFYLDHMIFEGDLFFYFILPPIIFAGGYNLKKRRFFSNFFYISLYGLLGTIINFIVVWLLTTAVNDLGWVRRYSDFETEINLDTRDILLFSATICATDSVAALAMIKSDTYPKLFSVIFGEGMVNDSVSIILYNSILDLVGEEDIPEEISFTFSSFMLMIAEFLKNASASLAIGIAWGLLATLITKNFRFLSHNPVVETVVVLLFGFCSFATAEILELSGVISILVCGIVMSHYLFYNISSTGKVTTGVTFSSISTIAEAGLYVYLGIIFWQTKGGPSYENGYAWSWTFLLIELGVAFFARFVSVFCLSWLFMLIKGKQTWKLNRYETSIIWFAGIIRGAIAFALIQNVPGDSQNNPNIQIIQSTTLFIVIITTVILGGLMPNYIKMMLGQIKKAPRYNKDHPSVRDSIAAEPKPEKEKSTEKKFFKKFDEDVIKKFFIFDYENRKEEIRIEKTKLKMNSAGFDAAVFLGQKKLSEEEQILGLHESNNSNTQNAASNQNSEPNRQEDNIEVVDEEQLQEPLIHQRSVDKRSINNEPEGASQ